MCSRLKETEKGMKPSSVYWLYSTSGTPEEPQEGPWEPEDGSKDAA